MMETLAERILFGQFIVNKGLATYIDIHNAIRLQEDKFLETRIGEILFKHFNVFDSEEHVQKIHDEFKKFMMNLMPCGEMLKEYEERDEKRQKASIVKMANSYLDKYIETSRFKFLERAILILEGEKEHKLKKQEKRHE